jgi:hypothetical protein
LATGRYYNPRRTVAPTDLPAMAGGDQAPLSILPRAIRLTGERRPQGPRNQGERDAIHLLDL